MKNLFVLYFIGFFFNLFADEPISSIEIIEPAPFVFEPKCKSPFISVGLSAVFPGLGHFYLGDTKTAAGFAGTIGGSFGLMGISNSDHVRTNSLALVQNTWFYGIYSSYRDVRLYNRNQGYTHSMPVDSLQELIYAPFSPKVMKKPEVWGGLIGSLALAIGVSYFAYSMEGSLLPTISSSSAISPLAAFPVGIGEEAFFRGYLQSRLAEDFNPWGAIAASSIVFGGAHIYNASGMSLEDRSRYYTFSIPLITTLGAYFGWLTYKNHSLKESVAIHSWYDFILFSAAALSAQSSSIKVPARAYISFSF